MSNSQSREFQSKDWAGDGFPSLVKSRAPGPPLRLSNSLWCLSFRPCCYCHQVVLRSFFVFHQLFIIVCCRKEFGLHFTRTHPFAAWLAHLSASFAGSLILRLKGKELIFTSPSRFPGLQSSSGETGNYFRCKNIWETFVKAKTKKMPSPNITSKYTRFSGHWVQSRSSCKPRWSGLLSATALVTSSTPSWRTKYVFDEAVVTGIFWFFSNLFSQALYIPVCVVKEIYRAKKVVGGIADASKVSNYCSTLTFFFIQFVENIQLTGLYQISWSFHWTGFPGPWAGYGGGRHHQGQW